VPVSGTVVDEAGRPLAGVEVALHAVPTLAERGALLAAGRAYAEPVTHGLTDGEGRFRVEAPEPGLWTAVARVRGKAPMEHPLWPLLAPAELEPVELLPDPGLRVLVVDGAGRPLAGAAVAVTGGGPRREPHDRPRGLWRPLPDRVAATGETGRARLPRFEDEEHLTLWAVAPGRSLRLEVDGAAAARPVRLVLAPGPVRRLRITGPGGRPAAGAAVWYSSLLPAGVTSEDGTIAVPLSAESGSGEPTVVQVDAPSGLAAETEVRPPREGEKAPLAVELEEPPRIAGRVLDARERRGVAGALVWIRSDPGSAARADRTGSFSLAVRRTWRDERLRAAAAGYLEAVSRLPVEGSPGAQDSVLLLEGATVLTGSVVDGAGQPIEGAEVRVAEIEEGSWRWGRTPVFARTGRSGAFRVEGLGARAPHLAHVERQGYSPVLEEVAPAPERPGGRPGPLPELRVVLEAARAVRGRAVDEAGAPVAGALALFLPEEILRRQWPGAPPGVLTGESASDGRFELREVLPGRAHLRLSAPGRAPASREEIEIAPDAAVTDLGDLVLEPESFIEGRVVEPGGSAVPGATVAASRRPDEIAAESFFSFALDRFEAVESGPDGGFRIGGLRAGQVVQLEARKVGFIPGSTEGARAPSEEPVLVLLRPAATVSGRVVDARGRPVPEAEVRPSFRAHVSGARSFRRVTADDRGAFELTEVAPGFVALEATAPGHQVSAPVTLELGGGEHRQGVEVVLEQGVVVSGRVLSPDGLPVESATVTATATDLSSFVPGRPAVTGLDGRFTLDTLAPGRMVLEARREGYAPGKAELEVDLGGGTVDIHLGRGTSVSGWLLEADGAPASNRTLQLDPTGIGFESRSKATTALDGSFAFQGVAAGEYRLAVMEGHRAVWPVPGTIVVEDGVPRDGIEVQLPRLATVTGRLGGLSLDQVSGAAVGAVKVDIRAFDEHRGEVLEDGSYRFRGLTPGNWQVTAVHQGLARQAQGLVEIEPGQAEARLDLELRGGHTVTGTVRLGGEPLAGATVGLSGSGGYQGGEATTGLDGRFRLEGVPAGEHTAVVQDPATGALLIELIEVDGDRDLLLELEESQVSGTVHAADGSGPIAGAGVRLERDGEAASGFHMPSRTVTGADGGFLLPGVPAGRWRLVVEKPGYAAHVSPVEVVAGDVEAAPVLLEPAGVLELRVRLADGRTPSSLLVAVVGAGDQALATRFLRSTGAGRFLLETLPPGPSELLISAPESPSLRVRMEAPGTAEVVLPEGCTLVVTVPALAEEGSPAVATASDPSGAPALPSFRANAAPMLSGQAELTQLAPGPWTITVTAVDGRTWTGAVTLAPGPPTRLVLE
jgi:hypothetical protein